MNTKPASPISFDLRVSDQVSDSDKSSSPETSAGSLDGLKIEAVEHLPTDEKPSLPKGILKKSAPSSNSIAGHKISPTETGRNIRWADDGTEGKDLNNIMLIPHREDQLHEPIEVILDRIDQLHEHIENLQTSLISAQIQGKEYATQKEQATRDRNIPLIRACTVAKAACEGESHLIGQAIQSTQKSIEAEQGLVVQSQTSTPNERLLAALSNRIRVAGLSTDVFLTAAEAAHRVVDSKTALTEAVKKGLPEDPKLLSHDKQQCDSLRKWEAAVSDVETMNEDEERAYNMALDGNSAAIQFCIEKLSSAEEEVHRSISEAKAFDQRSKKSMA